MIENSKLFKKGVFRNIFIGTCIGIFLFVVSGSMAQEDATKSGKNASPTPINNEKVQELKEKLATKVAEIRENQKRGFYGEIASLTKTTFTLATTDGEIRVRYEANTEVFDISGTKKTEEETADLKNTQTVSVLGLFEPEDKTVTAKVILIDLLPKYIEGTITALDKTGAKVTLKSENKDQSQTLDYERTTKADEVGGNQKLAKSGFSRLAVGDKLHTWTISAADDVNNLSIQRLFRIPQEVLGATTDISTTPDNDDTTSVSGTPKSSPRATPKSSPKQQPKTTPQATPES